MIGCMKLNCILGLPIHSVAIPAVMGLHSDHGVDGEGVQNFV